MDYEQHDTTGQPASAAPPAASKALFSRGAESSHGGATATVSVISRDAAIKDRRDLCGVCTYAAQCKECTPGYVARRQCELFDVDVQAFAAAAERPEKSD
ncbi:MAG: hypothetical protein ABFC63_04480 [Thermoguttaceae bacterium]